MNRFAAMAGVWVVGLAAGPVSAAEPADNVARGKRYRLSPRPNYLHCTDAGDPRQLTDGVYTKGYFWTQKTTVGWSNAAVPSVEIDLGKVEPIDAVSVNMAAGTAGVTWPMAILLFVGDAARATRYVGDLVPLSAKARPVPADGYAVHRFQARGLATRGRFVTVAIVPSGPYVFCDEIEVRRGPAELLRRPPGGEKVGDISSFLRSMRVTWGVRRRLRADAAAVREQLRAARLSDDARAKLATQLADAEKRIDSLRVPADAGFRTVLPINDLHRRIFAVQAALWRTKHTGPVVLWQANRWDMLGPTEPPRGDAPRIDVAMMRNEYRGAAVNVSNVSAETARLTLRFEGLPGGAMPAYVGVQEVLMTDTRSGVPVAAALPDARREQGGWVVQVPPGMTRQVWLTFHTAGVAAGDYRGSLRIDPHGARVPVRLKVYPVTFPAQTTLHLCGWDYTDCDAYEATAANRGKLIRTLREHYVNTPWAQSGTLPRGRYDKAGKMIEAPDDARFRTWLARWPGAKMYLVFAAVGERFAGFERSTPPFEKAVGAWITWWDRRVKALGLRRGQFGVLLVDEPHNAERDRVILAYARVIRAAAPDVVIWEDPTWREPWKATAGLFAACDVLCPNLPMWIGGGRRFADFYTARRAAGQTLWFYSCSGPGKLLDPYAYHRMQHWFCWKHGATGSGFWAFGDSGKASSWNEYLSPRGAYTPLFLDERTVTRGKHMEAIREGVQDYEYLRMLADRVAAVAKANPADPRLAPARQLLATAADRVTACMTDPAQIHWSQPKDRGTADQVRIEVLQALAGLSER